MRYRDVALATVVGILWGMGLVVAKAAIEHFPPILLMAMRFALVSLLMVGFVALPRGSLGKIFAASLFAISIQYSLIYTGLTGLDASTTALLFQLAVPFAALLAFLVFGERLGARRGAGVLIAFAGVACLTGEPRIQDHWPYAALVVEGAFVFAFGQVLLKAVSHVGGFTLIAWIAIFATPQLFMISLLFERDQVEAVRSASGTVWFAVFYMAVIMTAVGYGLWYRLLNRYEVNQMVPFLLLEPLAAVLGGVIFLSEALTLAVAAGGALVIAGVGVIVVERSPFARRSREAA